MSQLGLGTAAIGRPQYINIRDKDDLQSTEFDREEFMTKGLSLLDYALERGITYFDTAPGYGLAEKMLSD